MKQTAKEMPNSELNMHSTYINSWIIHEQRNRHRTTARTHHQKIHTRYHNISQCANKILYFVVVDVVVLLFLGGRFRVMANGNTIFTIFETIAFYLYVSFLILSMLYVLFSYIYICICLFFLFTIHLLFGINFFSRFLLFEFVRLYFTFYFY